MASILQSAATVTSGSATQRSGSAAPLQRVAADNIQIHDDPYNMMMNKAEMNKPPHIHKVCWFEGIESLDYNGR
jgi:hypothetical protein